MEGLIDKLLPEKWAEVSQDKKGDGYQEYQVNRNRKQTGDNQFTYQVALDDGDAIQVTIDGTKKGTDPIKEVHRAELKIDTVKQQIIGIDIDGDFVEFKS